MAEHIIVQTAVPKRVFFPGNIEVMGYFGEKNISLYNGGQNIIIIVFMPIPGWFLNQFGTDNRDNDEYIWSIHVKHIIGWICEYTKEEKNGNSYSSENFGI